VKAESIACECGHCGRVSHVPADFVGREGRCPGCREMVRVAEPGEPALGAPPPQPPGPVAAAAPGPGPEPRHVEEEIDAPDRDAERPCPVCGESIKEVARKCRFCGTFLEEALRRRQRSGGGYRLASPGGRLAAFLIDAALIHFPLPIALAISFGLDVDDVVYGIVWSAYGVWGTAAMIYQWVLTSTRGITPGKRWLGLEVIRIDGARVDFASGVVLRNWLMWGIFLLGCAVYIGGLIFWVIDALMILSEDRRCLHDHFASTRVIEAGSYVPPEQAARRRRRRRRPPRPRLADGADPAPAGDPARRGEEPPPPAAGDEPHEA